jgi:hypothetical protein
MFVIPVRLWVLCEAKKSREGKLRDEIKKTAGAQSTETLLTDYTCM